MKTYSRGAKYTPLDTPYRIKLVGDKVYAFPSLTQLNVFKSDVDRLTEAYAKGMTLYTKNDEELTSLNEAVDNLYNERYEKWLKTR